MGMFSAVLTPILSRIGNQAADTIEPVLRDAARAHGWPVPDPVFVELARKCAGKTVAEQEHILETALRSASFGAQLGTQPIESQRPKPAASTPIATPADREKHVAAAAGDDYMRREQERERVEREREQARGLSLAGPGWTPALSQVGYSSPPPQTLSMANAVPGAIPLGVKAKYVAYGAVGTIVTFGFGYSVLKLVGWAGETIYGRRRERAV